jgi:hypothetical protein
LNAEQNNCSIYFSYYNLYLNVSFNFFEYLYIVFLGCLKKFLCICDYPSKGVSYDRKYVHTVSLHTYSFLPRKLHTFLVMKLKIWVQNLEQHTLVYKGENNLWMLPTNKNWIDVFFWRKLVKSPLDTQVECPYVIIHSCLQLVEKYKMAFLVSLKHCKGKNGSHLLILAAGDVQPPVPLLWF